MSVVIERRQDPVAVDRILRALPDWFGIESAIVDYVAAAAVKPGYRAVVDGRTIGIALVERHFPESAELYLIAVEPHARGQGVGRALVRSIEDELRADGVRLLQVKTVGESFEDAAYAQTRAFYTALGFDRVEEFVDLGWSGPTLLLAKPLS